MKIINHPTGAFLSPGTPDGTPGTNRKPQIQSANEDLIRQTRLAFPVPEKEYKGEVKERVVKTFISHLQNLGYSHGTILVAKRCITEFLEKNPNYKTATKTTITDHYQYLRQRPNKTRPGNLSDSVVSMHMYSIRLFYDYLEQTGIIRENPNNTDQLPKSQIQRKDHPDQGRDRAAVQRSRHHERKSIFGLVLWMWFKKVGS
jgi:hypothetical protein